MTETDEPAAPLSVPPLSTPIAVYDRAMALLADFRGDPPPYALTHMPGEWGSANWIVNLLFGLPSAAGHNATTFAGLTTTLAVDTGITDLTDAIQARGSAGGGPQRRGSIRPERRSTWRASPGCR